MTTIYLTSPAGIIAEITRSLGDCPQRCPCHWWPATECGRCCPWAGMRRTETGYEPWPDADEGEDEPVEGGHGPSGWW